MKILITGALGHIGSRMVRELPDVISPCKIVMMDSLLTNRYCSLFNLPQTGLYQFIEDDVLHADLCSVIKDIDVVLHLAAITDAAGSFQNKEQLEHNNYQGTRKVAEACQASGCPMIHISSTSVYGTQKSIVDEDCSIDDLQPQSPYAETKLKEERLLQDMGNKKHFRFTICRFGTIAGVSPGMRFHTAVNKFCWQAVLGQSITVWRTALFQKRPYLAIDDALRAVQFIIKHDLYDGRIYNVLTENLTVNDIIQSIQKRIPQLDVQFVDAEIMNQLSYEVSSERIRSKGFTFRGSIEKSINETIDWLKGCSGSRII
jgi:UDP-glucose 4-epimerase